MVNQGPNTNASQFFFTLGSTPELDKKNTLFGKIVGNTLFNMLKLSEGEIIEDTPVRKHKITKTEVGYKIRKQRNNVYLDHIQSVR